MRDFNFYTMKKGTLTGIIFGLLTFGILYLITTNKTLEFEWFEGKFEYQDAFDESVSTKTAMVSLGSVIEGKSALTFSGIFKMMFIMVFIPLVIGSFVGWRTNRKIKRREEMAQL
jgi:hypothetical protein